MRHKIPSILGIMILVAGIAVGVLLIGQKQIFRLGASADAAPKDVRISNTNDISFTVSWTTDVDSIGYVNWGTSTSLGKTAQKELTSSRIHYITIENLSPSTNYYFVINSNGKEFDNNAVPWSVTTGPALSSTTSSLLISGTINGSDNSPVAGAIVYVNAADMYQASTVTSQNGSWTIPLSLVRNKNLNAYASIDAKNTVMDIFVQGGEGGVATAQVLAESANPTPEMTLGQTYDFRGQTNSNSTIPDANVNLPQETSEETTPSGSFDLSASEAANQDNPVTLDSIDQAGEVVTTNTPEFFGEGPKGAKITITVESDPVTDTVTVGSAGSWKWSPPTDLADGTHTITIKWTDANGFLRQLTRTFVVQATEGEPGFESTPSGSTATPSPSPTPTSTPTKSPTPSPTSSPTPTESPSPSPTPTRVSIPSTEAGIPATGDLTPTVILITIGLGLFLSGIFISKQNIS